MSKFGAGEMFKPEDFINDSNYVVKPQKNLVRDYCPFYVKWTAMKRRVCAVEYKTKHPTYEQATCCEEWLRFSKFKSWMEKQSWEGMELDKDIIVPGNKLYSPETCCFIPQKLNFLFRDFSRNVANFGAPMGVTYATDTPESINKKRWKAQVSSVNKPQTYLGVFDTKGQAHKVWQAAKADALDEAVQWWAFDPCVNHTFQQNIAVLILDRAEKIRHDLSQGLETTEI